MLPVSSVKIPVAKVDAEVNAFAVIAPAVLLPMRTFVALTSFNIACVKESVPAPPAIPIVVPDVVGTMITSAALPAPEPVPPICDVALNAMVLAVRLAVPVVSNNEAAFKVNAPVPALTVRLAVPELTVVLAAWVMPRPVKEIALFVVLMLLLTVNNPLEPKVTVPAPPVIAPLTVVAPVLFTVVVPPPL